MLERYRRGLKEAGRRATDWIAPRRRGENLVDRANNYADYSLDNSGKVLGEGFGVTALAGVLIFVGFVGVGFALGAYGVWKLLFGAFGKTKDFVKKEDEREERLKEKKKRRGIK